MIQNLQAPNLKKQNLWKIKSSPAKTVLTVCRIFETTSQHYHILSTDYMVVRKQLE
uniref:Uncharacterized protein n=1 Tax=Rhizophora mucronata TaxID=61149 RepID=A0A2P2NPK1_RHIMU